MIPMNTQSSSARVIVLVLLALGALLMPVSAFASPDEAAIIAGTSARVIRASSFRIRGGSGSSLRWRGR